MTRAKYRCRHRLAAGWFGWVCALLATVAVGAPLHGIALHGQPKYGPNFEHFDYVNPNAPKGGEARFAFREQLHAGRIEPMLLGQNARCKRVGVVPRHHRHGGLADDRPGVHLRRDEVHGAAGDLDACLDHSLMHVEPLERREQ